MGNWISLAGAVMLGVGALATTGSAGLLRLTTGDVHQGEISLRAPQALVLKRDEGQPLDVDLRTVIQARFTDDPDDGGVDIKDLEPVDRRGEGDFLPPTRLQAGILLKSGSFLNGAAKHFGEKSVTMQTGAGAGRREVEIPMDRIATVVLSAVSASRFEEIPAGQRGVILPKGDFFMGELGPIDDGKIRITSLVFGPQSFDLGKEVSAIVYDRAEPPATEYEIWQSDGSVYFCDQLQMGSAGITVVDRDLGTMDIPNEELQEIRFGRKRYRAINRLMPRQTRTVVGDPPKDKPYRVDSALDGTPMMDLFGKGGLALAAGTSLTYDVPPSMSVFMARIAVPTTVQVAAADEEGDAGEGEVVADAVAPKAGPKPQPVRFMLAANGKVVYQSPVLKPGTEEDIRVALGGASQISLYVEPQGAPAPGVQGFWLQPVVLSPR